MKRNRYILVFILAALAAGLLSCGKPASPSNVIVIVMDTLRRGHLSSYGYERNTSPNIDAFAKQATFYTRAFATAPWTVPTHGSIFTGLLPFEHGARTFKKENRVLVNPLAEEHVTLAEVFRDQGYQTAAFVANNGFLSERWQFDQGFQLYHVERLYAEKLNKKVFAYLDSIPEGNFFLFINYIDTHRVYNAKPRPGFLDHPPSQDRAMLLDRLTNEVMPGNKPVPAGLAQMVIDQYDTAVANLDEQIGGLIAFLKERGLYDETTIVLTADHGEYFGEHHLVEHSKDVYEEAVEAPLIIKHPGQKEGKRVDEMTSLAAVPALVFAEFPKDFAADQRKHFLYRPGKDPVITQNYFTRNKDFRHRVWGKRFDRVRTAVYDWPYKLIRSSDGKSELYQLEKDPREQNNLIETEPGRVEEMAAKLLRFEKGRVHFNRIIAQPPPSNETLKRLKSLGYIGK